LVELLVVIAIVALVIALLLPALSKARQAALRTKCLANMRSMEMAQMIYAQYWQNKLIVAGDGSYAPQGGWITILQQYSSTPLLQRCPADNSPYFDNLDTDLVPAVYRLTSYGINADVSVTHTPTNLALLDQEKITQIRNSASVIQFVELAEFGSYAVADHVHPVDFYEALLPNTTLARICGQMPVGRHGGQLNSWNGILNYGFLDGHAESLRLSDVYLNPSQNHFDPTVAP
jgi:prepilin-type processing-associated H-X9-DG protein